MYGAVLASTLPTDLGVSIWAFVHVAIAGLLAQLAGTASIRIAEFCLPVNIHSPMCREWGAAQVFVASVMQTSCLYEPGLVATVLLPGFLACNVLVVYPDWNAVRHTLATSNMLPAQLALNACFKSLHPEFRAELFASSCVFICLAWRAGILAHLFAFCLVVCLARWSDSIMWSFVGIVCMLLEALG